MANSRRDKMSSKEKHWRKELYKNGRNDHYRQCAENKPVNSAEKAFNRPAYGSLLGKKEVKMKIIFDSEEQKKLFMSYLFRLDACPTDIVEGNMPCKGVKCSDCWAKAIEMEVKNGQNS